jgi:hypothetical protein
MGIARHWNEDGWVDEVYASIAPREPLVPGFPSSGELWTSVASGRRGRVSWVSQGQVRLVFDDDAAGVTHCTLDFLRLYQPVK